MSRERRLKVQNYVLGIKDQKKKAATELYLARYAGFKIQGDGRLEFGIEDEKPRGEKCGKGSGRGSCAVM
jgi:hypothetical protein